MENPDKRTEEVRRKIANAPFFAVDSRKKGDFGFKTLKSVLQAYREPQPSFGEAYKHRGSDVSNPNTFYTHSEFALDKGLISKGYSGYQIMEKGVAILNL